MRARAQHNPPRKVLPLTNDEVENRLRYLIGVRGAKVSIPATVVDVDVVEVISQSLPTTAPQELRYAAVTLVRELVIRRGAVRATQPDTGADLTLSITSDEVATVYEMYRCATVGIPADTVPQVWHDLVTRLHEQVGAAQYRQARTEPVRNSRFPGRSPFEPPIR